MNTNKSGSEMNQLDDFDVNLTGWSITSSGVTGSAFAGVSIFGGLPSFANLKDGIIGSRRDPEASGLEDEEDIVERLIDILQIQRAHTEFYLPIFILAGMEPVVTKMHAYIGGLNAILGDDEPETLAEIAERNAAWLADHPLPTSKISIEGEAAMWHSMRAVRERADALLIDERDAL